MSKATPTPISSRRSSAPRRRCSSRVASSSWGPGKASGSASSMARASVACKSKYSRTSVSQEGRRGGVLLRKSVGCSASLLRPFSLVILLLGGGCAHQKVQKFEFEGAIITPNEVIDARTLFEQAGVDLSEKRY